MAKAQANNRDWIWWARSVVMKDNLSGEDRRVT